MRQLGSKANTRGAVFRGEVQTHDFVSERIFGADGFPALVFQVKTVHRLKQTPGGGGVTVAAVPVAVTAAAIVVRATASLRRRSARALALHARHETLRPRF
jgi:hypothetical protein